MSKSATNRRNRHEPLIDAEAQPWRMYWRAACWLMSELRQLHRRDSARARRVCEDLTKQTRKFAKSLNDEAGGGGSA